MTESPVFHKAVFDRISIEKRERVLRAAAEEFADKGLNAANVNVIAQKADISVGSLYKYFDTKTDLYLTVVNLGVTLLEQGLNPILDSNGSLEEKIRAIIDAIVDSSEQEALMTRLYNRFTTEGDPELTRIMAERLESVSAEVYRDLLGQAKAEGRIEQQADPRMFAFFMDNLFLSLQFSLTTAYYRDRMELYLGGRDQADLEDLKDQMTLFLKNALGLR